MSSDKGAEYWLIGVKNEGTAVSGDDSQSRETVAALSAAPALSKLASVSRFEIPELRVGTLEKLMTAGDLLHKVDQNVEATVRRIEKQFDDLCTTGERTPLGINSQPPGRYVENFHWNAAKYPTQRAVDELIRNIVTATTKMETELREGVAYLQEKKQRLSHLQKAGEANLMTADLGEVLTPVVEPAMFHDSTYLKTCVVVVSKSNAGRFEANYEALGSDLVDYGPEEARDSLKGSPVVPGSLHKALQDRDYSIYLVTILKKFYDPFKTAAQLGYGVVRDYDFTESYEAYQRMKLEGDSVTPRDLAQRDADEAAHNLRNWCITHFGDAFMAWVHIKAIRVFVESVLRYGLPVNFAAAVIKPTKKGTEPKIRQVLQQTYEGLDKSGLMSMQADEKNLGEEVFPYVSYTIVPEIADQK